MTVKLSALLITLGSLALAAGLALGLTHLSLDSGASCGNAFRMDTSLNAPMNRDLCNAQRDNRRGIALALVIPGAILALAGAGIETRARNEAALANA